ncbi:MAG: hypothetical protein QOJ80_638 [Mycobacterium sp.]|jgi:hypothetical protein|nr:hypothetical protein [Mycobacterium sp.]
MTTTEPKTNAWGREATGIPPIQCPEWCTDPGHIAEHFRADQNCYSFDTYVDASLAEVEINEYGVCGSRVGAMAYRGFNKYPVVLIHVEGFDHGLDETLRLTAEEAKQLAQYLLVAADHVGGDQ